MTSACPKSRRARNLMRPEMESTSNVANNNVNTYFAPCTAIFHHRQLLTGRVLPENTAAETLCPSTPLSCLNQQDVCYRDVAWLNGDRLVLAAHEGLVTLVSPSDVLHEWDVHANGGLERATLFRSHDLNLCQESSISLETDGNFSSGDSSSSSSGLAGRSQGGIK